MGITVREIVEELGGGASDGGQIKAVQTGGPSGGCIPASLFDTPVDYESLAQVGSIMGSGGMVVMDEATNMVELAKFYHGVLHGRVLRQVHPLPRRHRADAPAAQQDHRRPGHRPPTSSSLGSCASLCATPASAASASRPPTR